LLNLPLEVSKSLVKVEVQGGDPGLGFQGIGRYGPVSPCNHP
jgi:hypothetical protein